jgi:tryptophan-rich sensory protein
MKQIKIFIISILICLFVGWVGSLFTLPSITTWYAGLVKPTFSPPNSVFGPVWTVLYILLGIALFLVWRRDWQVSNHILEYRHKPWNKFSQRLWTGEWQRRNIIIVFSIQLLLNLLWSYIFFNLKMPGWAFFELVALWCSIVCVMVNFYRVSKVAAWILLPYLIWVSFAGVLNFAILMMN